ncbi:hypothetical protein ACGFX8_32965 [Streptomyces sp. NPDC048362]|uniref:hypothetical protein n=1 Tax=Streptomyces sp. NPDC048362 TaxID=3365539 RepID=UPI00370FED28
MSSPELKAAYQRLAEAIEATARLEGAEGVLTEWVVVFSTQRYTDDGDAITQVGTTLPDGGGQLPYHRLMGLLDYALTRCRAVIASDDEGDES